MFSRAALCQRYLDHAEQFAEHAMFRALEAGRADASAYDDFLRRYIFPGGCLPSKRWVPSRRSVPTRPGL